MFNLIEPIYLRYPKDASMERLLDKDGREVNELMLLLNRSLDQPLMIYTFPTSISINNDWFVYFKSAEEERFFVQELHFLLEEVNGVEAKIRRSSHEVEVTYQQVLEGV